MLSDWRAHRPKEGGPGRPWTEGEKQEAGGETRRAEGRGRLEERNAPSARIPYVCREPALVAAWRLGNRDGFGGESPSDRWGSLLNLLNKVLFPKSTVKTLHSLVLPQHHPPKAEPHKMGT